VASGEAAIGDHRRRKEVADPQIPRFRERLRQLYIRCEENCTVAIREKTKEKQGD
jgi:hypothetical protein